LAFCVGVFYGYWKGGHRRAEKAAVYYTVFATFFFAFSIIMWAVGAAILHNSKQNGNGQDLWGWSCKDNQRRQLFQGDVSYALVCRMQVRTPNAP
jgi:predicted permease